MEYVIICTVAIVVAALTFFSGLNPESELIPAFILYSYMDCNKAIIILFAFNSLFKFLLMNKYSSKCDIFI
jgi:hypothetical protein